MRILYTTASLGTCLLLVASTVTAADRPARKPAAAPAPQQNAQRNPQRNAQPRQAANNPNRPAQQAQKRLARRPNGGADARVSAPTVTGQVVALEEGKSITVSKRVRGGDATTVQFAVAADRSKVELLGDTKAIAVGTTVAIWADANDPRFASRIVAGAANPQGRARDGNANPQRPANPDAAPRRRPAK